MIRALTPAWSAPGVAPNVLVVNEAYTYDPNIIFNDRSCPALYLFRTGSSKDSVWYSDENLLTYDNLKLQWILPIVTEATRVARNTMMPAAHRALLAALERMRDPAYVATGDTDPQAATRGSLLPTFSPFWSLDLRRWKQATFKPKVAPIGSHDTFECSFELCEKFIDDVTRYAPIGPLVTTLQTADSPPLITGIDMAPAPNTGLPAQ